MYSQSGSKKNFKNLIIIIFLTLQNPLVLSPSGEEFFNQCKSYFYHVIYKDCEFLRRWFYIYVDLFHSSDRK